MVRLLRFTFSVFNPHNGRFGHPAQPGKGRIETPVVALLLDGTEVIGSGPTGPSVILNLALKFKPQASGRTFAVEVKASDDLGGVQGWDQVGNSVACDIYQHHSHGDRADLRACGAR